MDDASSILVAIVLALVFLAGNHILAYKGASRDTMQQAFERGYAVQCIGETGYYWECEK